MRQAGITNEAFFEELREQASIGADEFFSVIEKHCSEITNNDEVTKLFEYCGGMISWFKFSLDTPEKVDTFEKHFVAAMLASEEHHKGDPSPICRMRNMTIPDSFLEAHKKAFTRELFSKLHSTLIGRNIHADKVNSRDIAKLTRVAPYFYDALYECDFCQLIDDCQDLVNKHRWLPYGLSDVLKYALIENKCDTERIFWILKNIDFKYLPEITKIKYAQQAIEANVWNYKHLNDDLKETLSSTIDLTCHPMLVAFHPARHTMNETEWKQLINADPRTLRFTPRELLQDIAKFDDEYLLSLIEKNQMSYGARHKLVSFIYEIAPMRITKEFCLKIKAGGFHEQNHQIVVKTLNNKNI